MLCFELPRNMLHKPAPKRPARNRSSAAQALRTGLVFSREHISGASLAYLL